MGVYERGKQNDREGDRRRKKETVREREIKKKRERGREKTARNGERDETRAMEI